MYKFSEVEPTKAIANATNLTAIKDRAIVVCLKKNLLVDKGDNKIMFEKGDIAVVTGRSGNHIDILAKSVIEETPSDVDLKKGIWNDLRDAELTGFANVMKKADTAKMDLKEFNETFEILDDQTAILENHIDIAKSKWTEYSRKTIECENAKEMKIKKEQTKIVWFGTCWLLLACGLIGLTIWLFCIKQITAGIFSLIPTVIISVLGLWQIASDIENVYDEYTFILACIHSKKYEKKLKQVEKEFEDMKKSDAAALNTLRRKEGWYTGE